MSDQTYTPPKVWTWENASGGTFASTNRPIAGPTHDRELPVGEHPFQLYSLGTPNGVKVTIMLEELLAAGHDAEYDAWLIKIGDGFFVVHAAGVECTSEQIPINIFRVRTNCLGGRLQRFIHPS